MSADEGHHENSAEARTRRLSQLIPLWPAEVASGARDAAAAEKVVKALERALRGERRRGRAGHWTYDINRHLALARALREERARLAKLRARSAEAANARRATTAASRETKGCPPPAS